MKAKSRSKRRNSRKPDEKKLLAKYTAGGKRLLDELAGMPAKTAPYCGPVILTTYRKDERGNAVGGRSIPFSSVEQAERYIAEIKRIGKALKSKADRVFRMEPMPPARASDYPDWKFHPDGSSPASRKVKA